MNAFELMQGVEEVKILWKTVLYGKKLETQKILFKSQGWDPAH